MADSYLSIAAIAKDEFMIERMNACVTQQVHLGNAPLVANDQANRPDTFAAQAWVDRNRYLWAASPDWGSAWDSALASGNEAPGKDSSVITDGMILATVQSLTNPPSSPEE